MSETKSSAKQVRKTKSLDQQLEEAQAKLRKLMEAKKQEDARLRERNQRAIAALIKEERLDTVPVENWREVMPKLRSLLKVEVEQPQQDTAVPAAVPQSSPATAAA